MDGQALVIEIGRRAKAKERAAAGVPAEEKKGGDVDAVKESAAEDVVKALGIDPEQVDLGALATALCDLYEAHTLGGKEEAEEAAE